MHLVAKVFGGRALSFSFVGFDLALEVGVGWLGVWRAGGALLLAWRKRRCVGRAWCSRWLLGSCTCTCWGCRGRDVGKLGSEVGFGAEEGVGVGSWIGGEAQLQLGLESGVVVDGFDKSGEDVMGRGGVLEKSKFGNADLIVGKAGGEVGWACRPCFELGFEFEKRSDVEGVPCSAAIRCMMIGIVTVIIPNTGPAMRARFSGPMDSSRMAVNSATAV
jgi:hypothetical protein